MVLASRIILIGLFIWFIIGGITSSDGAWNLIAGLTLLAIGMFVILALIIIAFSTPKK
jgi:UDP-N-acetylmuramyl pentapeptide phosphotransferase/UDP-N-acetylglucosamine-1-phosphate transferase